jgi:putative DNA primase/helicase
VLISIDNVNGELGGDALCLVIERPNLKIRILGKTEQVQIEARGTSTFASGNNIVIVGDVCRRVIITTLDPQLERPELCEFRSNPVATVLADRGAYIAACLTICRAYIVAGRPATARKLASFEGWSDTVRLALIWLGKADCINSMEASREEDPERGELRGMLTAWSEAFGVGYEHRSTLASVIEIANRMEPAGYNQETAKHPICSPPSKPSPRKGGPNKPTLKR